MATNNKSDVVRRISRGRSGLDAKTKTDSGCFLDDELEKQSQAEKSPNAQDSDFKVTASVDGIKVYGSSNPKAPSRIITSVTKEGTENTEVQNVKEMDRGNTSSNISSLQDDSYGSLDWESGSENLSHREDFYCLYYSDSPQGSLTRHKERKGGNIQNKAATQNNISSSSIEDVALTNKQEITKRGEKKTSETKDALVSNSNPPNTSSKGPPVAPKPSKSRRRSSDSGLYCKDPWIKKLDESVPKGAQKVRPKSDSSLFQGALKELNEAQSVEQCIEQFDVLHAALKEDLADTLERQKRKGNNVENSKNAFPKSDMQQTPTQSTQLASNGKSRTSVLLNKGESKQASGCRKTGSKKRSPLRIEHPSCHSKCDSHKRSHMNTDSYKPSPAKVANSKTATKLSSSKGGGSQTNGKKDQKPSPSKEQKTSITKPESQATADSEDGDPSKQTSSIVLKRSERLEMRSSRKRLSGDLSSIPENAIMDARNNIENRSTAFLKELETCEVIPLAQAEDEDLDLTEDELDDNGIFDLTVSKTTMKNVSECSLTAVDDKKNESDTIPLPNGCEGEWSEASLLQSPRMKQTDQDVSSSRMILPTRNEKPRLHEGTRSPAAFSPCTSDSQYTDDLTSDTGTGYSSEFSANDADDETDGRADFENSENFQIYQDPGELVEMTFGAEIDETVHSRVLSTMTDNVNLDELLSKRSKDGSSAETPCQVGDMLSYVHVDTPFVHQTQEEDSRFDSDPCLAQNNEPDYVVDPLGIATLDFPWPSLTRGTATISDMDRDVTAYEHTDASSSEIDGLNYRNVSRESSRCIPVHTPMGSKGLSSSTAERDRRDKVPDPSGFMTVEDIKRLLFKNTGVHEESSSPVQRPGSFSGIPSSPSRGQQNEHQNMKRRSWAGYEVQTKPHKHSSSLVCTVFQNPPTKLANEYDKSPFIRTISQQPLSTHGYHSDSNLNSVREEDERVLERSQSFCGTPIPRRTDSLDRYWVDNNSSVSNTHDPRRSLRRLFRPAQPHALVHSASGVSSASECGSIEIESPYNHYKLHNQNQRTARNVKQVGNTKNIDDARYAQDLIHHDDHVYGGGYLAAGNRRYKQPWGQASGTIARDLQKTRLSHSLADNLRIQALQRASLDSSNSDSGVDWFTSEPQGRLSAFNTNGSSERIITASAPSIPDYPIPRQQTLSERFSDVPQRMSLEELADIGYDENIHDESYTNEVIDVGPELEFDDADYSDEKTMLVAEAMRLKKAFGGTLKQDPVIENLVTSTTRPPPLASIRAYATKTHTHNSESAKKSSFPRPTIVESDTATPYDSDSETEAVTRTTGIESDGSGASKRDSETQTVVQRTDDKIISANELLELLLNASKDSLSQPQRLSQSHQQQPQLQNQNLTVQNIYFPVPQTKSASTGNIHAKRTFPGHVYQLYGNPDGNSVSQSLSGKQPSSRAPQYTKSHDCLEKNISRENVLKARMVSSFDDLGRQKTSNAQGNRRKIFEEEIDCMKTRDERNIRTGSSDFSTSGSSLDDDVETKGRVSSVSYIGCENTKEIETLPRVKLLAQKKRKKERLGSYYVDKNVKTKEQSKRLQSQITTSTFDGETAADKSNQRKQNSGIVTIQEGQCKPNEDIKEQTREEAQISIESSLTKGSKQRESEETFTKKVGLRLFDLPKIKIKVKKQEPKPLAAKSFADGDSRSLEKAPHHPHVDERVVFHNDNLPSPNSVNVFIDYKKHVMRVSSSTPKTDGKPNICFPQGISPVISKTESSTEQDDILQKRGNLSPSEEMSPNLKTDATGDRSSSTYSSDDDRFGELFGSTDTVVFVGTSTENVCGANPTVDCPEVGKEAKNVCSGSRGKGKLDLTEEEFSSHVDSILEEVKASMDIDCAGSDLLDQALERVKEKLSPRSQNKATGGLTMEAYVALHQADELQAIINEIKGELLLLQGENTMLKEQVVTMAKDHHSDTRSTGEATEDSLTESSDGLDAAKRHTVATLPTVKEKGDDTVDGGLITVDVFLRGFGKAVGLRNPKKADVKLGTVVVKGGTNWAGVYEAAKTTFLDHIKRIDSSSYLGLSSSSMHGVQTGATMWTPETLRRHTPRVEISRKCNSCIIQLKDGRNESCDSVVYDTLIPKTVIDDFLYQVLEYRFVVLCGPVGLGKSYLASKLAEHLAERFGSETTPAVMTLTVGQTTRKELKKILAHLMKCDIYRTSEDVPAVIILDQLNCLASLADIFDPTQLEGNRTSPFIIGVRDKSKKGPFSSKDLSVYQYFRWIQMSVDDKHIVGLLERFLRRKLSWTENVEDEEQLLDLFYWLTQVWQRINQIIDEYCNTDVTIGPSLFFTCPMDVQSSEGWFGNVWNYTVIPYLHQTIRNSSKIYERNTPWDDPTKWVIMRWPWERERSKILPTLRKLRQVDIVLNRNHVESPRGKSKRSRGKVRKSRTSSLKKGACALLEKAGSLESWGTADWESVSSSSDTESSCPSTLERVDH